jgi:predicted ATP-binding protein involved in virulence
MILHKLYLQNFRSFEKLEIDFDPRLTVIVAENGVGKTTVLDAVAYGLGKFLSRLPKISSSSSKETDLRINNDNKLQPFLIYGLEIQIAPEDNILMSAVRRRDRSPKTLAAIASTADKKLLSAGLRKFTAYANSIVDSFNEDTPFVLPVFAYYGTNRAILDDVRRRNFRKEFSRFDALSGALRSEARFKSAFEWYNAMEDLERREKENHRDFDYTLPELDAVRSAIESMLYGFSNLRTEVRPVRLVIDRVTPDDKVRTYRISQLSDGYRVMLGLVMDLARRMVQANPPSEAQANPLNHEAIVLIDEIDLHLHPAWQQTIIGDLQRTFPNTQFIVTTHSPQVLTTVPAQSIRGLCKGENAPRYFEFSEGAEPQQILEEILGVTPRPPNLSIVNKLNSYLELVSMDKWDTEEALKLRRDLMEWGHGHETALTKVDMDVRLRSFRRNGSGK